MVRHQTTATPSGGYPRVNSLLVCAIVIVWLIILTAYLIGIKRPSGYTLYPAIFMLVTTMAALVWNAVRFFFPPAGGSIDLTLGIACVVLLVLGGLVATEAPRSVRAARAQVA